MSGSDQRSLLAGLEWTVVRASVKVTCWPLLGIPYFAGAMAGLLNVVLPMTCNAQVAPSQVTPQNLRPETERPERGPVVSPSPTLKESKHARRLWVVVSNVRLQGAFPEFSAETEDLVRAFCGKRVSVDQIFAFAKAIEKIYSAAGYPLVRVVIPPQNLVDNGALVVAVVDGFIEAADVTGVPETVRNAAAARLQFLVGRRHITISEIERGLLIAGNVPGLRLKSALVRGRGEGGTRLVVEGEHHLVTGSIGTDDRLPQSLGTWQLRGAFAVNGAIGFGEQIYATVGHGLDLRSVSPFTVYGGGAAIPLGNDGLTLNPEYTHSTTRTSQVTGVPGTHGVFERVALRLYEPVVWTRSSSINVNASADYISQRVSVPTFGALLSEDRYGVVRIGSTAAALLFGGAKLELGATVSQGVGGRNEADALETGTPLSRFGAGPYFTKVNATARIVQPLLHDLRLDVTGLGQISMGKPLFLSEQFSLDGAEAVSAFAAGTFSADQGATVRGEITRPVPVKFETFSAIVSPYFFGVVGRGWLADATSVEQSVINAGALGFGARAFAESASNVATPNFGIEFARQFTNANSVRPSWRASVVASVVF